MVKVLVESLWGPRKVRWLDWFQELVFLQGHVLEVVLLEVGMLEVEVTPGLV